MSVQQSDHSSSATYTCLESSFSVECRYRKTSIPRCYRIIFTVPTVLRWNFPHPRGNYRGYRGTTAFPITVSSSSLHLGITSTTLPIVLLLALTRSTPPSRNLSCDCKTYGWL